VYIRGRVTEMQCTKSCFRPNTCCEWHSISAYMPCPIHSWKAGMMRFSRQTAVQFPNSPFVPQLHPNSAFQCFDITLYILPANSQLVG